MGIEENNSYFLNTFFMKYVIFLFLDISGDRMRYIYRAFFLIIILTIIVIRSIDAHEIFLFVEDNNDGTVTILAEHTGGSSVKGAKVVLRDKYTGQPLFQTKLNETGQLRVKIPTVPYTVTLDMGKDHRVTKTGSFYTGIKKNNQGNKNMDKNMPYSKKQLLILLIGAILVFSGIIIGLSRFRINK